MFPDNEEKGRDCEDATGEAGGIRPRERKERGINHRSACNKNNCEWYCPRGEFKPRFKYFSWNKRQDNREW